MRCGARRPEVEIGELVLERERMCLCCLGERPDGRSDELENEMRRGQSKAIWVVASGGDNSERPSGAIRTNNRVVAPNQSTVIRDTRKKMYYD